MYTVGDYTSCAFELKWRTEALVSLISSSQVSGGLKRLLFLPVGVTFAGLFSFSLFFLSKLSLSDKHARPFEAQLLWTSDGLKTK